MNSIKASTYIPISLVIVACSASFKIGASKSSNDFLVARVEALETKSIKDEDNGTNFQKEVLQRLASIESSLKHLLKGD